MSDITEGIGAAIEGALTGRAVEPAHGEGAAAEAGDGSCLNCGAQPTGDFCQSCGQRTHVHRTLSAIGHDLIHGVLHLDGKFWRTIPLLVFKPGKLTRRYIDGERAKFVSPMAMFLFSVFAMFAVFQMIGLTVPSDMSGMSAEELENSVEGEAERVNSELEELDKELAGDGLSVEDRALKEEKRIELAEAKKGLAMLRELPVISTTPSESENASGTPVAAEDSDGFDANITGIDALDKGLVKKWREQPDLMLYKMQANGYKFSWLLIPLSVPFVWLTFAWRRRFRAYDHSIFVTYSLSFMSLLFIAASLLSLIPAVGSIIAPMLILVPPIHLYKQLRGTYQIGRLAAFWRLLALSVFIWIVIILFLQALLVLGAF